MGQEITNESSFLILAASEKPMIAIMVRQVDKIGVNIASWSIGNIVSYKFDEHYRLKLQ